MYGDRGHDGVGRDLEYQLSVRNLGRQNEKGEQHRRHALGPNQATKSFSGREMPILPEGILIAAGLATRSAKAMNANKPQNEPSQPVAKIKAPNKAKVMTWNAALMVLVESHEGVRDLVMGSCEDDAGDEGRDQAVPVGHLRHSKDRQGETERIEALVLVADSSTGKSIEKSAGDERQCDPDQHAGSHFAEDVQPWRPAFPPASRASGNPISTTRHYTLEPPVAVPW